jgi:hypothetical protein
MVDFANIDTLFCSLSFVTFRRKFPSDSSTAEWMLFINDVQMEISIRDFQYGGIRLQYMLITFLVIT